MKKLITISKHQLKYYYYITDDGRVWSEKTKKYLSQSKDKDGYMKVTLCCIDNNGRHRFSIHRLVLENFLPVENMENLQVNHIDGNKENNNLNNLEWMTCKENINHAIQSGLRAEVNGAAKLTKEQVLQIRKLAEDGESNISIGQKFSIHPDTIGKIKNKRTWSKL